MLLKPLHVVQPPDALPHEVPSVSRAQACDWVVVEEPHVPLVQVYAVAERDWVPASPQVPLKPPQALQLP